MTRMMDIGRPTNTNKSRPLQSAHETKDEGLLEPFDSGQTPVEPLPQSDYLTQNQEPLADKTPEDSTKSVQPRAIASYAIDDTPDQKTFPLTPVLMVVGAIVVIGLVYLLVFI